MNQPFLSIVTRCCMRPKALTRNIKSVLAQTDKDLEQVFILDNKRVGLHAANMSFAKNKHRVHGRWVYILDDDCKLTNNKFVARIRAIDSKHNPDIIIIKSKRPPGPPSYQSTVPTRRAWQEKRLYHGSCNALCYVVRAGLWRKYIEWYGKQAHGGDWQFLKRLLKTKPGLYWHDEIMADACQLGRGKLFENCKPGWLQDIMKQFGAKRTKLGWIIRT